ncbi:homoserine O-acetyltransferase [Candidatus Woesearchaeota archaeon]|nr:homoserine O-acetyltransferase [Candidatus Woesearchaeota archaeon]|tara:strand:+ start:20247 stop:21377 length:1131 start_codon:yes stop_codon:yes gene_type:complete
MENSKSIVKTKYMGLKEKVKLESGKTLPNATIAYETYGKLNKKKTNAIYIFHALSGDAHVAGSNSKNDKNPGWWDYLIGPGKGICTRKYFVICANVIGGCKGSTGPGSINPKTKKTYGLKFPIITVKDMVNAQKKLIDFLGVKKLLAVIGGSLGGMQVLEFISSYPNSSHLAITIGAALKQPSQGIAFHEVGRQAIMRDPNWKNGSYYNNAFPNHGLSVARMLSHITYMSEKSLQNKFGRNLQDKKSLDYHFGIEFQVESYLNYQGLSFIKRFDANSYLLITRAMDYFDLSRGRKSVDGAFKKTKSKCLVISMSSDWLYPTKDSLEIVSALRANNIDTSFIEIDMPYGHDSFLIKNNKFPNAIRGFIDNYCKEEIK